MLFQGVVKPALWVFAVPVFALWFSSHVMGSWDAEVREGYRASVVEDQSLSESDRQERLSGVEGFAASAYCVDVDPTSDDLRQALQPICDDMWMIDPGVPVAAILRATAWAAKNAARWFSVLMAS